MPTSLAFLALALAPQGDWLLATKAPPARCGTEADHLVLENGLVRRTLRTRPGVATVALDDLRTGASHLRAVEPEAVLVLDGKEVAIGGLVGQANRAFLTRETEAALTAAPSEFDYAGHEVRPLAARLAWKTVRPSEGRAWPPPGIDVTLRFVRADGVRVEVHHELYEGLPLFGKWLAVTNGSARALEVTRCRSESLALVEGESSVEKHTGWRLPPVEPFSDFAFCAVDKGRTPATARYVPDPAYRTQVSYELGTPCLLRSEPAHGPAALVAAGDTFVSHRTWLLVHDDDDRERRGFAVRRMLRTLAPWSTENPILMHVRSAEPEAVRLAIDQCAAVGFEMVVMTFGSGFDVETEDPRTLARYTELARYAKSKGVELGGYGLLASRSIGKEHDVVDGSGRRDTAVFGSAPCLGSAWGERYFTKLRAFFAATGMTVFEHDGSYAGDVCASTSHPGHRGLADSQWRQGRTIADFYAWCRAEGVYLNVPDTYLLAGSSKMPMGYRETNWSLPRAEQVLHARQNVFDGTWEKAPSMGWMFVPLVEYHGGGPAATIEPLSEHLDVYRQHFENCFGAGVQACWRGPRLYDGEATKALVAEQVAFFKKHRAILESDLVHWRRADGRDVDGFVHVNPGLDEPALAVLYNPLEVAVERAFTLPLWYSGLRDRCRARIRDGAPIAVALDPRARATLTLRVPARGMTWVVFEPALGPWKPGLPCLDLAADVERRSVLDREKGRYLGHPTTTLLGDGRTLLAVYPEGHGKGAIRLARSEDGGRTWETRLPTPKSWETSLETPSIHRVRREDGGARLLLFSGLHPIRLSVSEDEGRTWSELAPIGPFGGIVAMSSLLELRDGTLAAWFHDDGRYLRPKGARREPGFRVLVTRSQDRGLTWSEPELVVHHPALDLCEPGVVRSPDGGTLALLLRENSRKHGSQVVFSQDEGRTWSAPVELPPALHGDRHVASYAADGRLVVVFRDMAHDSPTRGDFVAWVGTWDDLRTGAPGTLRVRLLDNRDAWDCGYAGLERTAADEFVATTYGHWEDGEAPYVVSVRFGLAELLRRATDARR